MASWDEGEQKTNGRSQWLTGSGLWWWTSDSINFDVEGSK